MDSWQKHVFNKCSNFVGNGIQDKVISENEVLVSINQKEAYVIVKALEDQQRYLNPIMILEPEQL